MVQENPIFGGVFLLGKLWYTINMLESANEIEVAIMTQLLTDIIGAGHKIGVIHDDDWMSVRCTTVEETLSYMFNEGVKEQLSIFHRDGRCLGVIRYRMGEGTNIILNHNLRVEPLVRNAEALARSLANIVDS